MSIKALKRRAREARAWLGEQCLPLWAEAGVARTGGFLPALAMSHRPPEEAGDAGGPATQEAMMALFALAPRVGFDAEQADQLCAAARAAIDAGEGSDPPEPDGARTLASACASLLAALETAGDRARAEETDALAAACDGFDTLMDDFLTYEGGWIAGYDAGGLPLASDMPARLARHIAAALGPLVELAET